MAAPQSPRTRLRESLSLKGMRSNFKYPEHPPDSVNHRYLFRLTNRQPIKKEYMIPVGLSAEYVLSDSINASYMRNLLAIPQRTEGFKKWIQAQHAYTGERMRTLFGSYQLIAKDGLITSLDQELLYGYTYLGDALINNYLRGSFESPINDDEFEDERFMSSDIANTLFRQFFTENYERFSDTLTLPPKEELKTQDGVSQLINENIDFFMDARNFFPIMEQYKKDLLRIIYAAPRLPAPLTVYRGFKKEDHIKEHDFVSVDFTSTSLDVRAAIKFSSITEQYYYYKPYTPIQYYGGVYEITISPRVPCIFMGYVSQLPEEFEVLLPPGIKFSFDPYIRYKTVPKEGRPISLEGDKVAVIHVMVDLPDGKSIGGRRTTKRKRTQRGL